MKNFKIDTKLAAIIGGATVVGGGLLYFLTQDKEPIKKLTPEEKENVTRTLRICVTGAAGQIGYSFLPMLANGSVFGPHVKVQLRLLDIPAAVKALEGISMELHDGAYPLLEDVAFGSDPEEMFKECDVVVFIGGFPRKQGMERKELLNINGNIFKGQGKALDKVAKKTVKCLVVANPANTNCLILQQHAPSIPKENFTCLTRLDHNRAVSQLWQKTNMPLYSIKNVIIWGNHSSTQYPDVNHGMIAEKPIKKVVEDENWLKTQFISKVQKRGAEIIEYRGSSSVFSAANAIKDHLSDWYHGTEPGTWVSMGIVSDGSYGVPKGIVFSYPVRCKRHFDYEIVQGLHIDDFSQEKINVTTKELLEEKAEAFAEEPKPQPTETEVKQE